jgi:hypothetical protein
MVNSELMNPDKFQEAVSADSAERLATSSEREQIITVSSSSFVTPFSISYEVNDLDTLTLVIPYVQRKQEITVGGSSIKTGGQGLGDIQLSSRGYILTWVLLHVLRQLLPEAHVLTHLFRLNRKSAENCIWLCQKCSSGIIVRTLARIGLSLAPLWQPCWQI